MPACSIDLLLVLCAQYKRREFPFKCKLSILSFDAFEALILGNSFFFFFSFSWLMLKWKHSPVKNIFYLFQNFPKLWGCGPIMMITRGSTQLWRSHHVRSKIPPFLDDPHFTFCHPKTPHFEQFVTQRSPFLKNCHRKTPFFQLLTQTSLILPL